MTSDYTPARLRELAENAFDTEFRVLQAALRAAADAIEVERETNGATALLLQQARTALAAREALLKEAGSLLAKFAPKEPMPAGLPDATIVVTNHNPSAYFAADIYAARALAAEIAAALGGKTDE